MLDLYGLEEEPRLCEPASGHFVFEMDGPIVTVEVSPQIVTVQRARSPTAAKVEIKKSVHLWLLISQSSGDYCEVHGLVLGRSLVGDGYERLGVARKWSGRDEFPWTEETIFPNLLVIVVF